jgi:putative colanic acid biosynthesis acetyltransferase WcaF
MDNKIISDLGTYTSNYKSKRNGIVCVIWYFISLFIFQSYFFPFYKFKKRILILFGANVGKNLVIKPNVIIKYPWNLVIGNNVWIGENAWIDNLDIVTIHDSVCISQSVYLLTGNHNYKSINFDLITKPIVIHNGAWIGAKAVVCPGVIVHSNAIVTVGSILTKNAKPNKVYTGNPAVAFKDRI